MKKNAFFVPFYDLRETLMERLILSYQVYSLLKSGQIILGEAVKDFETSVANFIGRKHACAVSDGTSGLFLALQVANIKQGDEVITTPLSWIATSNAIKATGATPIFCDVDSSGNIDPLQIRKVISNRTKAIMPVHFYGKMCDIEEIVEIATRFEIPVIEDAAQSFGASRNGRFAGSFGALSVFSFNPVKTLASLGEAGMVLSDNAEFQKRLEALRYLGMPNKIDCQEISLNYKIDTLQAKILLKRMKALDKNLEKRRQIAETYTYGLPKFISKPAMNQIDESHTFFDYCISTEYRDALHLYLNHHGIETKLRYPKLISDQPPYKIGNFQIASNFANYSLCLPIYPKLKQKQIEYVIERINMFFNLRIFENSQSN